MRTTVYIDDSGTPGYVSNSKYDTVDRKTWVGLILNPDERIEANLQMKEHIDKLKLRFNANEFHFTDIYSGRKGFEGVDLKVRLDIFRIFAEIHKQAQYPMFIQTFTSDDILRNKIVLAGQEVKMDNFDLKNVSDLTLYFLLLRIKEFFEKNTQYSRPIEIIIDEGRQKKDTSQDCVLLEDMLLDNKIYYKSSTDEPLLQLIDFVAFTMNRVRWIMTNDKKGKVDIEFLRIAENANFNILNIKRGLVKVDENFVERYDEELRKVYSKNETLAYIELHQLINNLKKPGFR